MRTILTILTIGILAFTATTHAAPGAGPWAASYAGPGSIVASFDLGGPNTEGSATFVDNGAIVCEDVDGDGIYEKGRGGTCISFAQFHATGMDSILVEDALAYRDVAFQVCVDANGDGVCGDGFFNDPFATGCRDIIYFSHSSFTGGYSNPMYMPYWAEQHFYNCGYGGFPGYIVILCAGAHQTQGDPTGHTHEVTFGQTYLDWGGAWPSGDYCGAPTAVKAYQLI